MMRFSNVQINRIRKAKEQYDSVMESTGNIKEAKEAANDIINSAFPALGNTAFIQHLKTVFYGNYDILDILMDSNARDVIGPLQAFVHVKPTNISPEEAREVLSFGLSRQYIVFWLLGDSTTRAYIDKYKAYDEVLFSMYTLDRAGIDFIYYVDKYKGNMLKTVATILGRQPTFDVTLYNKPQLTTISRHANSEELLSLMKPEYLPDTIRTICKNIKAKFDAHEVIACVEKYPNDMQIVSNYFAVKKILMSNNTEREKTYLVADLINNQLVKQIAKCPANKNVADYLFDKYEHPRYINKAFENLISKVETMFPFMPNLLEQLKSIYLEVYDKIEDTLEEANRIRVEERLKAKQEAAALKVERTLPIALIEVDKYLKAVKEDRLLSVAQYCANNNIDKRLFSEYTKVLKAAGNPLYNDYKVVASATSARAMRMMKTAAKTVVEQLAEKKTKFNLYDYYTITKFEPNIIHRIIMDNIEEFRQIDVARFREFWEKYRYDTPMAPGWFYKDYISIKGREITKEDKDKILKYMGRMRYPLIIPIYKEIVRKYVDGTIEIK